MRRQANTVLVEDISNSMTETITGFNGQRIQKINALREANKILINYKAKIFPQDLIGCVVFAERAEILFKLTKPTNPQALKRLEFLNINIFPRGTTNLTQGLEVAIAMLRHKPAKYLRNIILLSDGCPNEGNPQRIIPLARQARKYHININTIGFGDRTSTSFDAALLKQIAKTTHNGRYQHCKTLPQLVKAFKTFSRR